MIFEFKAERVIDFVDTDMAGIVHFSNYFRYMESTEHEFFRSLGHTLHRQMEGSMKGWARVHAQCDYKAPIHYNDRVEIHLIVLNKTRKSFTYAFLFQRRGVELARGKLTVLSVTKDFREGRLSAADMDSEIYEKIEVAPAEVLERLHLSP